MVLGNFIPSRVPVGRAAVVGGCQRGDGLGCRKHLRCRHPNFYSVATHYVVAREIARRSARQAHPRNVN